MENNTTQQPKKTTEIYTFKKGKVYHLDDFYNIQAFVMPHSEPYRSKYNTHHAYDSSLAEQHKMLKTVKIKIEITIY